MHTSKTRDKKYRVSHKVKQTRISEDFYHQMAVRVNRMVHVHQLKPIFQLVTIGPRKILDMFNFRVKKTTDLLFGRRLWTAVGSFLVGRSQKRYSRPVEL